MEQRVEISESEANALEAEFQARFALLHSLFDKKPFRLAPDDRGRQRVSAALYDASMVAMDKLWSAGPRIERDKDGVQARVAAALNSDDQLTILTGQGNTAKAVRERIELMMKLLAPAV